MCTCSYLLIFPVSPSLLWLATPCPYARVQPALARWHTLSPYHMHGPDIVYMHCHGTSGWTIRRPADAEFADTRLQRSVHSHSCVLRIWPEARRNTRVQLHHRVLWRKLVCSTRAIHPACQRWVGALGQPTWKPSTDDSGVWAKICACRWVWPMVLRD